MILQQRFSDLQLEQIIEEAAIYMCACPGQVAVELRNLRSLFRYQHECEQDPANDNVVHRAIAEATLRAHALMEDCMDKVLEIEGWDRETLRMPEGMRRRRADLIEGDS
jgi:hypothetical protein